jgi:hypothetical protein
VAFHLHVSLLHSNHNPLQLAIPTARVLRTVDLHHNLATSEGAELRTRNESIKLSSDLLEVLVKMVGCVYFFISCLLYDGILVWSSFIAAFSYYIVGKWRQLSVGACSHVHLRNCSDTVQLASSMHTKRSLSYKVQKMAKNSNFVFVVDREWKLVNLLFTVNPLTPRLNPVAQTHQPRFFSGHLISNACS